MNQSRDPSADKATVKPSEEEPVRWARALAQGTSVVFVFPSCVIAGYLMGAGLDTFFETAPILAMVFLILGAVAGFHQMYRILTRSR